MTFRAEMAPFYFRGYLIERKHKDLSIIRTYLAVVESHIPLIEYFEKILLLPNEKERVKKIQKIFYNPFGPKRGPFILAFIAIILELGLLYWLHFIWNWKMF
jgi:hypothetical protein